MKSKDARRNTFGILKPTDMLRKLEWERARLTETYWTDACEYAAIDMATTAFHTLDWIACEITERDRWEFVIEKFSLETGGKTGEVAYLKALQQHARQASPAMRICEQIANASKHRDLRQIDENIETFAGEMTNDRGEAGRMHWASVQLPDGGGVMLGLNQIAHEAHNWLLRFMDACGVVGANIPPD